MTAITAANSSASNAIASLLSNAASSTDADTATTKAATPGSTTSSGDPLDNVDLSDRAKSTLARARFEQNAADRLSAQVRAGNNPKGQTNDNAKPTTTPTDKISASFITLAGITAADLKPEEPTVPKVSFTSSLQAFGFSISASGSADSWSSDIQIRGPNGFQAWDTIWGGGKGNPTAGGGGASGLLPGQGYASRKEDGKVYFTIADASVSASAVATDDAFASSASAQLHSTTFIVDFGTGQISVQRTDVSANATSAGVNQYA